MIYVVEAKSGPDWLPVGCSRKLSRAQHIRSVLERTGVHAEYRISVFKLDHVVPG